MTSEADSRSPRSINKWDFTVQHPGRDFQTDNARDTKRTQLHRRRGEGAKRTQLEKRREEVIARICRTLQTECGGQRPLRIAFVGKYGSGKSSFINTVAAAFSEYAWREYAYTGFHGGSSEQSQGTTSKTMTVFTQSFDKCCNDKAWYRDVPLPTLIDVAGLNNDIDDHTTQELLRLLFYGHLKEESAIMKTFEFCQRHTRDEIRAEYGQSHPEMRVDRVVFVASAVHAIPERLMNCVTKAARPEHNADVKRSIPVFGVLTKKDKVSDLNGADFVNKKEIFMQGLALQSNRFLCCSNYCDDIDPSCERTRQLDPSIDLPVVEFFQHLCDPALRVIQDAEKLPGTGHQTYAAKKKAKRQNQNQSRGERTLQQQFMTLWGGLDRTSQALAASLVVSVVVWVVMSVLLIKVFESELKEVCRAGQDSRTACTLANYSPIFCTTFVSFAAAAAVCVIWMLQGDGIWWQEMNMI